MSTMKLRVRRCVRTLVAAVVVATAWAAMPGTSPAHAYDSGNCMSEFRAEVDRVRYNDGNVDFGDDFHLQGAPQGTAAVCWSQNGRSVQWMGKLYWDGPGAGCVRAEVDVHRTDDVGVSFQDIGPLCSTGGLKSTIVEGSYFGSQPNLSRVVVRLFSRPQGHATFSPARTHTIRFGTR